MHLTSEENRLKKSIGKYQRGQILLFCPWNPSYIERFNTGYIERFNTVKIILKLVNENKDHVSCK